MIHIKELTIFKTSYYTTSSLFWIVMQIMLVFVYERLGAA